MKTIVCVASGPSLTDEDVEYCRGRAEVIVVNDNYRKAPWAEVLYACDAAWWRYYIGDVRRRFSGQCWTQDEMAAGEFADLRLIRSADAPGLSTDPDLIHQGENSGYQAINLAFHRGAQRIVLLGYDMYGRNHWFGRHPAELVDVLDFNLRAPHFTQMAVDLAREGVQVINASRETYLTCFARARIDEALS